MTTPMAEDEAKVRAVLRWMAAAYLIGGLTAMLIHAVGHPVLPAHGPEPIDPGTVLSVVGAWISAVILAAVRAERDQ